MLKMEVQPPLEKGKPHVRVIVYTVLYYSNGYPITLNKKNGYPILDELVFFKKDILNGLMPTYWWRYACER